LISAKVVEGRGSQTSHTPRTLSDRKQELGNRCPICNDRTAITDAQNGELVCVNCGYVATERTDAIGPEWRVFSQEEAGVKARTGSPRSLAIHDTGLSTVIGTENKDASGRWLPFSTKYTIESLRRLDNESKTRETMDRNFRIAFAELDKLAAKLALREPVVEKAAYIYRKAFQKGLLKGGRPIAKMIAVCAYAACRQTDMPRTLGDVFEAVGEMTRREKKTMTHFYRLIVSELDLRMPVLDPVKCVSRIASVARISERTQRRALEILRHADESGHSAGKDRMGLAAAALYIACIIEGERKTQKEISDAAGVTDMTIRNRYSGLVNLVSSTGYSVEFGKQSRVLKILAP
jgi:transcription initiation factor TFIIB